MRYSKWKFPSQDFGWPRQLILPFPIHYLYTIDCSHSLFISFILTSSLTPLTLLISFILSSPLILLALLISFYSFHTQFTIDSTQTTHFIGLISSSVHHQLNPLHSFHFIHSTFSTLLTQLNSTHFILLISSLVHHWLYSLFSFHSASLHHWLDLLYPFHSSSVHHWLCSV